MIIVGYTDYSYNVQNINEKQWFNLKYNLNEKI